MTIISFEIDIIFVTNQYPGRVVFKNGFTII